MEKHSEFLETVSKKNIRKKMVEFVLGLGTFACTQKKRARRTFVELALG